MKNDNTTNNTDQEIKLDKKEIVRNTLIREVIRIDVLKIKNMSDVIANLRPILNKYGFEFTSRDIDDIDLSVEDADELETYDIKKALNKWDSRKYLNKDEKFVINENIIFFEKTDFYDYKGIEYYIEMMTEIINTIIETEQEYNNFLYIDRIGVRKVNRVTGENFEVIAKVFKCEDANNKEVYLYDEFESKSKKILQKDDENLNIIRTIEKGVMEKNDKEITLYSSTLDIDAYCREYGENIQKKDLQKELKKLGNMVCKQFVSYNNEILNKILTTKNEKELQEIGICDGISTFEKQY